MLRVATGTQAHRGRVASRLLVGWRCLIVLVVQREGHAEQYRARRIGPQCVYVYFQVQGSTRMDSGEMNLQDRVATQCAVSFQIRNWEGARGTETTRETFPRCLYRYSWKVVRVNHRI